MNLHEVILNPKYKPTKEESLLVLVISSIIFSLYMNICFTNTVFLEAFLFFFALPIMLWLSTSFMLALIFYAIERKFKEVFTVNASTFVALIFYVAFIAPYSIKYKLDLYAGGVIYPLLVIMTSIALSIYYLYNRLSYKKKLLGVLIYIILITLILISINLLLV